MTNGRYIDLENECLRGRLAELKAAATRLADTVDRYVRQGCLRSELLNTVTATRDTIRGVGRRR